jgi:DNA-binding CsgD family transcriptional regulator
MGPSINAAAAPSATVPSFDDSVGQLYAAATGALSWPQALQSVAALFGASLAALQRIDLRDQRLLAHQSAGSQAIEDGVLQYVRKYHALDPRRAQLQNPALVLPGGWYHDHEHLNDAFVANDAFYQHFLAAYGARYLSATLLAPAPDQLVGFGLELSAQRGPLNADERELLRRVGEHLAEALRAHERLRRLQAQQWAGHQLLQDMVYPMWLIDLDRFVHFANTPAQAEAESERALLLRGSQLVAANLRVDGVLTAQLHALQRQGHGATGIFTVGGGSATTPLWLHLSLLVPAQAIGAFGQQPMVLLTLFDPATVPAVDSFALASLLALTPAQARVAARLAAGETPEAIAHATGTGLATVRSHLHAVLHRVGARRSAELVRVLQDGHGLWALANQPAA